MRVSVITPTLNSAAWITECMESVRTQAHGDLVVEHVVADGGSTDDTVDLAREAGVRLVPRDPTDSLPTAINKATLASTGDLVGFLGSDDVLAPGALAALADSYRRSGRRWVTGSFTWADADLEPIGTIAAPPGWMSSEMMACLNWCPISPVSTYMERSMFEELGGYDATFPVLPDYDLYLRARELAPFARVTTVVALYRRRGDNLSIVGPTVAEENRRILEMHGPTSPRLRAAYRLLMKLYMNGRNPGWALHKLRSARRH
jgi:GT2 family glycosyltransferase